MVEAVFWFLVGVAILALVGHGIWVAARFLVRGLWRLVHPPEFQPPQIEICPRCREPIDLFPGGTRCYLCGWSAGGTLWPVEGGPARVLALLRKRIERYHQVGVIPASLRDRLIELLKNEATAPAPQVDTSAAEPAPQVDISAAEPAPLVPVADLPIALDRPATVGAFQLIQEPEKPPAIAPPAPVALAPVAVEPVPAPASTVDRSQRWFKLLEGFLEEKNIRWGELVGGLLIVSCSLALVISFWSSIAERPLLKFGLFNGATALLFSVGFHAERRWRLPLTALGLLLIATLLVPLNFLAVASLGRGVVVESMWGLVGELVAIGLFTALTYRAGGSIVPRLPWTVTVGVVVPSAASLLIRRFGGSSSGQAAILALGAIPLIAQATGIGGLVMRLRREPEVEELSAHEVLRLLGLSTFAVSVAIGLLVVRSRPIGLTMHRLAPLAPLAGAIALAPGLLLWRRTASPQLVAYRTAGTAIAAGGVLMMLAGIALAWPDPAGMIPVALLDFGVFTGIAVGLGIPAAHALAGLCLALAYLLGWLVWSGRLGWQVASSTVAADGLLSGQSGSVLVPIVLLFAAAAGAGVRRGRRQDAQAFALVAVLAFAFSASLVTWYGFGFRLDPLGATWVYAVYGIAAFACAAWFGRYPLVAGRAGAAETRVLAWASSGLFLMALVQGLVFGRHGLAPAMPWVAAFLAHVTLAALCLIMLARLGWDASPNGSIIREVLLWSALGISILAAGSLGAAITWAAYSALAVNFLWLAFLWLFLAWRNVSAQLFAAFQVAVGGSVVFATAAAMHGQAWFGAARYPWFDPWLVQAQALALGALCLVWIGVRIGTRARLAAGFGSEFFSKSTAWKLLDPLWPAADRYLRGAVLLALVGLAVYAVVPGVAQELTPRDLAARLARPPAAAMQRIVPPLAVFEFPHVPHAPAYGAGSWALLILVLIVLLAGQWERFRRIDLLGAIVAVAMMAPLLAAPWESAVAAASALRWTSAVVLLVVSTVIWKRDRLAGWARALGWRMDMASATGLERLATATAILLTMLPLLAMGGFVAVAALSGHPLAADETALWIQACFAFIFFATTAIVLSRLPKNPRLGDPAQAQVLRPTWARPAGALLTVLGTLSLASVTLFVVGSALAGNPIVGPEPGSLFDRMGDVGSYIPPLVLVALALVGYAIRQRSSEYAFAAGLVLNLAATAGYLLGAIPVASAFDAVLWTRLAHVNAIVAAGNALAWMGIVAGWQHRWERKRPSFGDPLLTTTVALGVALNLIILVAGTSALFFDPLPTRAHLAIAGVAGWLALGLATGSVVGRSRLVGRAPGTDWLGLGLLCAADLLALGLAFHDTGDWRTYHAVPAGLALAAAFLLLLVWQRAGLRVAAIPAEVRAAGVRWACVAMAVVVPFAIRAYWSDPQSPWFTIGGLVCMVGLAATLAVWSEWPGFLPLAGALLNLAATFWWCDTSFWRRARPDWSAAADLLNLNVIALALPAPCWLWIDRRQLRPRLPAEPLGVWSRRLGSIPFQRFAAWSALCLLALVVVLGLTNDLIQQGARPLPWLGWAALVSVTIALSSGLWDERSRSSVAGLFLVGLCAVGWTVHQFHLPTRWMVWTGTMVLAAYSVGTSFLWSRRADLRRLADRLRIPRPAAQDPLAGQAWLVPANLALAAAVVAVGLLTILNDPEAVLRSSAAHAALAEALAIGLLARGERRRPLQFVALSVGVVGAAAWGWAWIAPGSPTAWTDRLVVVLVALVGTSVLYGLGLAKVLPRETEWTTAARRLVPSLLGLAAVALTATLVIEVSAAIERRGVPLSGPAIAAIALALVATVAAALVAALVPGRDPLGLSEHGRTAYVYGCEALLAVLLLHVRLSLPWLFTGFFARYWSLIILGVAYVGVGLAELFRREQRMVLAEPLERTGSLLPVLPILAALWTAPRPGEDVLYLVLAGGLYTALSLLRSSLSFGALAALAYNAALWVVLGRREGFALWQHPQLWVVPPALCILIGGYLNRDRLSEVQNTSIRYVASLAIYLSSTADILLVGVAQAPWLPLALAGLSILGIFGGIVFRVRGFLFLGVGFLALALFTIVWFAAVDLRQTWLWSASGIVAGILILGVFALFEKKREDVLRVVHELRAWNP